MQTKRTKTVVSTCLVGVCLILGVTWVRSSEVLTPSATKIGLKPPVWSQSHGTHLEWATDKYIYVSEWNQMMTMASKFSYWGNVDSPNYFTFTIDNANTSNNVALLRLSTANSSKLTIFGDGRLAIGTGAYTSGEKLHVVGNARITQKLVVEQGLGLGPATSPSSSPVIRPYATSAPSAAGAVDGDLAFDTDADPVTGYLSGGTGAWVVYDSTTSAWKVLKQF